MNHLISLTFDPSVYSFNLVENEENMNILTDYKQIWKQYFEMLREHINNDMNQKMFQHLDGIIDHCPKLMKKLLDGWYDRSSI